MPFGLEVGLGRDTHSLVVRDVQPDSPAGVCGVQRGWVLLAANDRAGGKINVDDFIESGRRRRGELPHDVLCVFLDGRRRRMHVRLSCTNHAAARDEDSKRGRQKGQRNVPMRSVEDYQEVVEERVEKRGIPLRFSTSPVPSSPPTASGGVFRSISMSPTRRSRLFGAIASLFKSPITSIAPGSFEAKVASRRTYRGWKRVFRCLPIHAPSFSLLSRTPAHINTHTHTHTHAHTYTHTHTVRTVSRTTKPGMPSRFDPDRNLPS